MKKFIFALVLTLAFGGTVFAGTTDLYSTPCFGYLKQCYHISNNGLASIAIVQSTSNPGVTLVLDGVMYTSPTGGGLSTDIANLVLTNSVGDTVVLNAHYSFVRKQINSGRLHMWVTRWTFLGGTIVQ